MTLWKRGKSDPVFSGMQVHETRNFGDTTVSVVSPCEPVRPEPRLCASCGSSKLHMKKKETAATCQIDAEKSLRIKYEVTEDSLQGLRFSRE